MPSPRALRRPDVSRAAGVRRAGGFTLVELMVVLVVAALLAGVAVPNMMPAIDAMRMRAAAGDIASALRYVRGQALSRGREATFFLDVEKHYYRVSGRQKNFGLPSSIKLELFTAEHELQGEGGGSIRFYPDGSATGGRVTLVAGNKKNLIDVNWLTGAIVLREDAEASE
ncbi:GspH/FimT family protein [Methyloterricola oryzae]|uniref:GspH/FimT family protein n=1 Tax=Methyloterricola oryzae TaxID=1495050 RepID=UPI0005EAE1B4|nr:GspH/FimT family protein [Methyloterricola oryzae]